VRPARLAPPEQQERKVSKVTQVQLEQPGQPALKDYKV